MLTCAEFTDRLYDEDCRRAMVAGVPAPDDMRQHTIECPTCRRAFEEAASDCLELPGLFRLDPPPELEARLVRLAESAAPPARRGRLEWRHTGNWVLTAGAVGAGLVAGLGDASVSPMWQLTAFVLAGSIAMGLQATFVRWADVGWQ